MVSPPPLSSMALLRAYCDAREALKRRGIVRTKNVVGDYGEYLFARAFSWALEPSSNADYDAMHDGVRYQVKARQVSAANPSRQLGDMPEDALIKFDQLGVIIFAEDFRVDCAAFVPAHVLLPLRTRVAGKPRFIFRPALLTMEGVRDVTGLLRSAQQDD